jgi:hypothetical protein
VAVCGESADRGMMGWSEPATWPKAFNRRGR